MLKLGGEAGSNFLLHYLNVRRLSHYAHGLAVALQRILTSLRSKLKPDKQVDIFSILEPYPTS